MAGANEEDIVRIIKALRLRIESVARAPAVEELQFLRVTTNHGEFCAKLDLLGEHAASDKIKKHAVYIGLCWLRLGIEHLEDARVTLVAGRQRATLSRCYYAAYNTSKAIRYIVSGAVSLKGDDHHSASDLPEDFPDGDRWSATITELYEHRLNADYDNWGQTASNMSLPIAEAFRLAEEFVERSRAYLGRRLGVAI